MGENIYKSKQYAIGDLAEKEPVGDANHEK